VADIQGVERKIVSTPISASMYDIAHDTATATTASRKFEATENGGVGSIAKCTILRASFRKCEHNEVYGKDLYRTPLNLKADFCRCYCCKLQCSTAHADSGSVMCLLSHEFRRLDVDGKVSGNALLLWLVTRQLLCHRHCRLYAKISAI
jgi:hypothetical protein